MRAAIVESPGKPEVLELREVPRPKSRSGWVLIKVMAFGLNRSEIFTRQGHSGAAVTFPRILGIECVGVVEAAPDSALEPGQKVAAVMGGMGRAYDGSYAEYTLVPVTHVMPVTTELPWETFAAIPEAFLTAWGSLVTSLKVEKGDTLLIRGGTSSVGMAAVILAKDLGARVIATTRNPAKKQALMANGADHVVIDDGSIVDAALELFPAGVSHVLELIGPTTLLDSLRAAAPQGVVCNTGILGNAWVIKEFEPMAAIPSSVYLTTFLSETVDASASTSDLQRVLDAASDGRYRVIPNRVFRLDEIVEAHRYMEANEATGKIVVRVSGPSADA
jgi:NADPH:quinone reductase-like Zn-dependent oxidoreductase